MLERFILHKLIRKVTCRSSWMSPHIKLTETWEIPSKRVFRQIIFLPRRFLGLRQLWKFPVLTCGTSVLYCFCSLHTCMFSWWNGLLIYGSTPYAFHCYVLLLFMNPYSTQPSWKSWSTLLLAEDSNTIFHGIWFPFLLRVSFGFFLSLPFSPLHLNLHLAKVQLLLT